MLRAKGVCWLKLCCSESQRSEMCCFGFLLVRSGDKVGWICHCNCSILFLSNVSLNLQSKDNFEAWFYLQRDYTVDSFFLFKRESSLKAHESEGLFNYFLICQQYTQLCSEHKDIYCLFPQSLRGVLNVVFSTQVSMCFHLLMQYLLLLLNSWQQT